MGKEYVYIQVNATGFYDFPFELSEYRYLSVIIENSDGYVVSPNMIPLCILELVYNKYFAISYYDGSINPIISYCIREDKKLHCNNLRHNSVLNVFIVLIK